MLSQSRSWLCVCSVSTALPQTAHPWVEGRLSPARATFMGGARDCHNDSLRAVEEARGVHRGLPAADRGFSSLRGNWSASNSPRECSSGSPVNQPTHNPSLSASHHWLVLIMGWFVWISGNLPYNPVWATQSLRHSPGKMRRALGRSRRS